MDVLHEQIWYWKLHSRTNHQYYMRVCRWWRTWHALLKLAAFLASSAVIVLWLKARDQDWVVVLSVVAALATAFEQTFRVGERVALLERTVEDWKRQIDAWDRLWLRCHVSPSDVTPDAYERVLERNPPDLEGLFFPSEKQVAKIQARVQRTIELDRQAAKG